MNEENKRVQRWDKNKEKKGKEVDGMSKEKHMGNKNKENGTGE